MGKLVFVPTRSAQSCALVTSKATSLPKVFLSIYCVQDTMLIDLGEHQDE